jgi:hypothetical protein
MSAFDDELKDWLPTRGARLTATVTVALVFAAFGLPEALSKLGISFPSVGGALAVIAAPALVLAFGSLVVLLLVLRHYRQRQEVGGSILTSTRSIELDRADPLASLLAVIAKNYSLELPTTPRHIAKETGMDEGVVLAHLWKYHNEQYVTFRSGGAQPSLDTTYFLSPKAWECITVAKR